MGALHQHAMVKTARDGRGSAHVHSGSRCAFRPALLRGIE